MYWGRHKRRDHPFSSFNAQKGDLATPFIWGCLREAKLRPLWFKKKKILFQNNFLLSRNFTCKMLAVFRLLATPRIILRSYTHKSFYPDHSEDSWLLSVCSLLGRSVLLLMCVVPLLRTWFENLEVFLQVWLFPLSS